MSRNIPAISGLPRFRIMDSEPLTAFIEYDDPYVHPLVIQALQTQLPHSSYELSTSLPYRKTSRSLQIRSYESINFEQALDEPQSLINAYIIRKALIRKHYLSSTIFSWVTKHPGSALKTHFKASEDFELDYAEFLDDALVEAFDLRAALDRNAELEAADREWWILKPGMSDRGQGIRLFSTMEELTAIFEEWEAENPDSDEDEDGEDDEAADDGDESGTPEDHHNDNREGAEGDHIVASHLRHFIAQPYIHPPLLVPNAPYNNRKFHIRTYVVAAGALRVYVYDHMLALFASETYAPPWEILPTENDDDSATEDLLQKMRNVHLTNTCVQKSTQTSVSSPEYTTLQTDNVFLLSSLPLPPQTHTAIQHQVRTTTSELFQAALSHPTNFQPLPQAFEVFGVDFMVDEEGTVWLLEVNAFPDFAQTGDELRDLVVKGLWEEVVRCVVAPHFGVGIGGRDGKKDEGKGRLVKVFERDLGRR